MHRLLEILVIALLAACTDDGSPPFAGDQTRVRFPAGGVVDVIEVDAVNRLPLRKAELIAPDGLTTPASYLNVNPAPGVTSSQGLPNGPYAGNALGVGNIAAGDPLPALIGGAPQQRTAFLAMVSDATIPLPDPVEYRRAWQSYRLRLTFGDPLGDVETKELDAPEPPPGAQTGATSSNSCREPVKEFSNGWISAVRPSRQPLRGFLRMRNFLNGIDEVPHAEERHLF